MKLDQPAEEIKKILGKPDKKLSDEQLEKLGQLLFHLVYKLTRLQVRRFALPTEALDDIVSSVVILLWTRLDRLREVRQLAPYLHAVVRNKTYMGTGTSYRPPVKRKIIKFYL